MLNGRVTAEQMQWLVALADDKYQGNMSAALREALGLGGAPGGRAKRLLATGRRASGILYSAKR